jgi:hypothetical protein
VTDQAAALGRPGVPGDEPYCGGVRISTEANWGDVVPVLGRSGFRRLGASGLLFGIAAILRLGYWSGPNDCSGPLFSCVPVAEPVWVGLTSIALVVALIMLGTELRAARPAS